MNEPRIRILMDCDTGDDDACAIALAAASDRIDLLGITAVMGNLSLEQTCRNARELIRYLGADVPVAKGSEKPLKRSCWLGSYEEQYLAVPGITREAVPEIAENAVEFMTRILLKSREKITLIPVGPLTNIARLMLAHPQLMRDKVERLIVMGGGVEFGNVTKMAELNLYADAEAGDIVFSFGLPIVMVGLDVCHKAQLFKRDAQRFAAISTRAGNVFSSLIASGLARHGKKRGYVLMYDSLTIIYALHPEIFITKPASITVVTQGEDYGRTVCDFDSSDPLHTVVLDIDREKYLDIVEEVLRI